MQCIGGPFVLINFGKNRLARPVEVLTVLSHELVALAVVVEHAVDFGKHIPGNHVPAT